MKVRRHEIIGDVVHIQLTRGKVAIVDMVDADLALLNWCAHNDGPFWYAWRNNPNRAERPRMIRLHRVIAKRAGFDINGHEVDHVDLDGLNNRRSNIRAASHAQNRQNTPIRRDNVSGIKGVSWDQTRRKWQAHIAAFGKHRALGRFDSKEEAARAYAAAAERFHGDFARLE